VKGNIHVVYMASTRNRNSDGEYKNWETAQNNVGGRETQVLGDVYSATRILLPDNGLIHGRIPGTRIANNTVDIESNLRGIRANDMVNGAPHMTPDVKKFENASFAKSVPLIMPAPLNHEPNQRAMYMN